MLAARITLKSRHKLLSRRYPPTCDMQEISADSPKSRGIILTQVDAGGIGERLMIQAYEPWG
jgi:hypothetical protein